MEDGRMVTKDGGLIKPRFVQMKDNTQDLWSKMYFGFAKKKLGRSFAQMVGLFAHEYGYHPPRNLMNMPKRPEDWYRHVHAVERRDLIGRQEQMR